MEACALTVVLGIASAILCTIWLMQKRSNKYPPGPTTLPLLGNLHQIIFSGSMVSFCEKNRKKFGNLFSITIGGIDTIIASGYDVFNELLLKQGAHTSLHPGKSMTREIARHSVDTPGISWAPYPHWKNLRTIVITALREEGMGKTIMEPRIMEEVENYISHFITPSIGSPINVFHSLPQASSNVISQLLFGFRLDYASKENKLVCQAISDDAAAMEMAAITKNLPMIDHLPYSASRREQSVLRNIIIPTIRKLSARSCNNPDKGDWKSVVDRMNSFGQRLEDEEARKYYNEKNGVMVCTHLYEAGTETTSTALKWILLYMCHHPNIQKRVHEEIDEQIGRKRAIVYKDRLTVPYTEAVMLETLRKANILPMGLIRHVEKDLIVDGVHIPAGADLMLNMASVLHDETVFEEPDKFKPERYLTGDVALKKQRTMAFGIGRRSCPGESLARMEFFLFFVTFLQRFEVELAADSLGVDDRPIGAFINVPKSFNIVFKKR